MSINPEIKTKINDMLSPYAKQTILLAAGVPCGTATQVSNGGCAEFWCALLNQCNGNEEHVWSSAPVAWKLISGATTNNNDVKFKFDMALDLSFDKRFTLDQAQAIRYHVVKTIPKDSLDYQHLSEAGLFHSTNDIFKRFSDRMISVKKVADAIDFGIGNKRVADMLRELSNSNHTNSTPISTTTATAALTTTTATASVTSTSSVTSNPFMVLSEKKKDNSDETFGQIVSVNNDLNYLNFCRILNKTGDWEEWINDNNLVRTTQIEQFVADIKERQVKEGKKFNAAHAIFMSIISAIPEWNNKPLIEFLNDFKKKGYDANLSSAINEWIDDISINDSTNSATPQACEVGLRKALRELLSPIFRDTERLKNALDALLDKDRFDMMYLEDLKDIAAQELFDSRCFNNREARAVVKIAETL